MVLITGTASSIQFTPAAPRTNHVTSHQPVVGRAWSDTNDRLTRHSHRAMNGQKRMFGEPFQTPSGALLNYPGDTSLGAGAEEVVGCRCTKQYRIDMTAEVLRGQQVR